MALALWVVSGGPICVLGLEGPWPSCAPQAEIPRATQQSLPPCLPVCLLPSAPSKKYRVFAGLGHCVPSVQLGNIVGTQCVPECAFLPRSQTLWCAPHMGPLSQPSPGLGGPQASPSPLEWAHKAEEAPYSVTFSQYLATDGGTFIP